MSVSISKQVSELHAISNIRERFNSFDRMTTQELSSASFQVLEQVGHDPNLSGFCTSPKFTLGHMESAYITSILSAVRRCKELSNTVIGALRDSEKNELKDVCPQIDTYIDSKIFQVLSRITLAKNFINCSHLNSPLYPVSQEMWKFQNNNHGRLCSCYNHIHAVFSPKTTQITIRCDIGLENALYIRGVGPGMSWDKGIKLTNKGGDMWVYEVQGDFPYLEYKILRNDTEWEPGKNRRLDCGKKENISLRY